MTMVHLLAHECSHGCAVDFGTLRSCCVESAEMAAKRDDGSQGGCAPAAQQAQATLGSIMQLVAMVDMLRDNLVVLGGKSKEWLQEMIDISAVVADAVKKAKPLMKASKVKLLADIGMELEGIGEAQRYVSLTPLNYAEHSYSLSISHSHSLTLSPSPSLSKQNSTTQSICSLRSLEAFSNASESSQTCRAQIMTGTAKAGRECSHRLINTG
jgi:hypothetical protein